VAIADIIAEATNHELPSHIFRAATLDRAENYSSGPLRLREKRQVQQVIPLFRNLSCDR
jgi:hypothetical protein